MRSPTVSWKSLTVSCDTRRPSGVWASRSSVARASRLPKYGSGMTDRAGIDAIKILKIVADVGEAVLHRLGGRNAGHLSYVFQAISGGGVRPRYGDIGAVGELSIHEQLSV